eukprot:COSAG01_NODE_3021_length_6710_cov_7.304644_3_plen_336_part_00
MLVWAGPGEGGTGGGRRGRGGTVREGGQVSTWSVSEGGDEEGWDPSNFFLTPRKIAPFPIQRRTCKCTPVRAQPQPEPGSIQPELTELCLSLIGTHDDVDTSTTTTQPHNNNAPSPPSLQRAMDSQSGKITGVHATVVSVNSRGWATAEVSCRATNEAGTTIMESDTIAVQAKYGFGRGDKIRCVVVPSKRGREGWFAIGAQPFVERKSNVSWAQWQVGTNNLVQSIPDTAPGSDHDGIAFACWRCGNEVTSSEGIHRIKGTAVWTNTADLDSIVVDEQIMHNKWKRCDIQNVRCRRCTGNIGTYYQQPFYDSDTDRLVSGEKQVFPCIKFATNR